MTSTTESTTSHPKVLIIGGGAGGIAAAVNLKHRMNIHDFVMLEKTDALGGTWRNQVYPGCACDIPAPFYSFSFELYPHWSRDYPPQQELCTYMDFVADKYDIRKHIQFGVEVQELRWLNDDQVWEYTYRKLDITPGKKKLQWDPKQSVIAEGLKGRANVVLNFSGPFNWPYTPDYPGQERFSGKFIHTAYFDHSIDLTDKKVAIVGSGPTAIQIAPEIVHKTKHLTMYQRTPNWIAQLDNDPYPRELREKFVRDPSAVKARRQMLMDQTEKMWGAIGIAGSRSALRFQQRCIDYMQSVVKNKDLWPHLTPDYPIGCKRIMWDCNFLALNNRSDFDMVFGPIQRVTERGMVHKDKVTGEEVEREYDVIIWATGWGSFSFGRTFPTYGATGQELYEYWKMKGTPIGFMGAMVSNYPNLMVAAGPYGNVWTSFIELIEERVDFACRWIQLMCTNNIQSFAPSEEAEARWERRCREGVKPTPYAGKCVSYYKFSWDSGFGASGKQEEQNGFLNVGFFPGLPIELRMAVEEFKVEDFVLSYRKNGLFELPPPPPAASPLRLNRMYPSANIKRTSVTWQATSHL
ncbi:FAD/NAD(P)-binding domain-containing protein [Gonapodya prolifera JEL478]|uniref:FAD/NAD(P)-binding domain-containing protein n=1 Tax=Gonapodya prolifera (strain JEL478) TaxID=1344416 RepID=A0A138ZYX2_GONPJ|nr:FAD/NAD(P)-binding domain-containing protein [Gonapodya prolifera JEL478]|eukprot:KXS09681.1 FAD/NAD(P)-binding domain-containing protein [Gonapodya prolifera JEL478]